MRRFDQSGFFASDQNDTAACATPQRFLGGSMARERTKPNGHGWYHSGQVNCWTQ
jgi:hypothetical protein